MWNRQIDYKLLTSVESASFISDDNFKQTMHKMQDALGYLEAGIDVELSRRDYEAESYAEMSMYIDY